MNKTHRWTLSATAIVVAMVSTMTAQADVRLPHVFGSHMVLQRDRPLPVWGWADAGEAVQVKLGDLAAASATAGPDGKWQVSLPPTAVGGPYNLTVSGKNTIVLDDVVLGDVWVCSGQSNMEMVVASCNNAEQEIAAANYPDIRHIKVPRVAAGFPQEDFDGAWEVTSPDTAGHFTACGYFMARHLYEKLRVPIGLINTSWGGTRIEPWTPPVGFADVPALDSIYKQVMLTNPRTEDYKQKLTQYLLDTETWIEKAKEALMSEAPLTEPSPAYPAEILPMTSHGQPTTLYNAMVSPLLPFAFRGAIWYQGESNHGEGMLYTEKMKALIGGWRKVWGQGDFPFYYVQIAPYEYGTENPYVMPTFWEAQTAALSIPNTGQVITTDIADYKDIHPKNKQAVGLRLALLALNGTYGHTDVVCNGPTFKSMSIEGDKLRLSFDNVGSGLASRDGKPLDWFEIIGKGTDFVKADAVIDGETVVLSSPEVKEPAAMRFAWHKAAEPNFMNKEGLPAVPFRAGEVPKIDYLAIKVDEAKDYKLVYSLDLAKLGANIQYDEDNSQSILGPIDRIAYFLELRNPDGTVNWVYTSMDPFTQDLKKIGIPTVQSKALFQQKVGNLNVLSNVAGIATGTRLAGGCIEFWPYNYGQPNAANIPNASGSLWDFGDQYGAPEDGYGSMQVGNFEAKQTVWAINAWKSGGSADIGIGNSDGETRDWTFKHNAGTYPEKRLRVLVHVK